MIGLFHEGIDSIQLVYENCEVVTIPRRYILELGFYDFKKSFCRTAMNAIENIEVYSHILLEVDGSCDKEVENSELFSNTKSLMDFLADRKDITQISVNYIDKYKDNNFHFFVDWESEDDYENKLQTTLINDDKDVAIIITNGNDSMFNEELEVFKSGFFDVEGQRTKKELYSID